MALQGPMPAEFRAVYPSSACPASEVETLRDFDRSRLVEARSPRCNSLNCDVKIMQAGPPGKPRCDIVARSRGKDDLFHKVQGDEFGQRFMPARELEMIRFHRCCSFLK